MAKKKLLYVQTSGVNTPQRLYSPFILAQTALAMNVEPTIYFLGEGVTVVKKGEAEKIKIGNFPSLKDVIDETLRQGIKLLICQQSAQLLEEKLTPDDFVDGSKVVGKLTPDDFVDGSKIVGAATLNNLVLEADGTMWF